MLLTGCLKDFYFPYIQKFSWLSIDGVTIELIFKNTLMSFLIWTLKLFISSGGKNGFSKFLNNVSLPVVLLMYHCSSVYLIHVFPSFSWKTSLFLLSFAAMNEDNKSVTLFKISLSFFYIYLLIDPSISSPVLH